MEITFLGSGTSTGIPQIGCNCKVCTSTDTKDKRLRASVLIKNSNLTLLIDCGPDLRQQLLRENVNHIDAVLITHEHYDHIGGLDDVRPLGNTHIYAERKVLTVIKRNMPYSFSEDKYPGVPLIHLHEINESAFRIDETEIIPIRAMHAKLPILGFRINNFAYLTDIKTISDDSIRLLQKLDLLVINALRIQPHISHLSLSESLIIAKKIDAQQTFFTHISHDMGLHREIENTLPATMHFAYDGLKLYV